MREIPSDPSVLIVAGEFPGFTPEEMFEHWTDIERLTLWWPQGGSTDPGVGGGYRFAWTDSVLSGRYTAFERGRHLGFTWSWTSNPDDCQPLQVDVWMMAVDGGTRLAVHHGPYCESDEDAVARQGHREGWMHFLMRLAGLRGSFDERGGGEADHAR